MRASSVGAGTPPALGRTRNNGPVVEGFQDRSGSPRSHESRIWTNPEHARIPAAARQGCRDSSPDAARDLKTLSKLSRQGVCTNERPTCTGRSTRASQKPIFLGSRLVTNQTTFLCGGSQKLQQQGAGLVGRRPLGWSQVTAFGGLCTASIFIQKPSLFAKAPAPCRGGGAWEREE